MLAKLVTGASRPTIVKQWEVSSPPFCTLLAVQSDKCLCAESGYVMQISMTENHTYSVAVRSGNNIIRYSNLSTVSIRSGEYVQEGQSLGEPNRNIIRIEYGNTEPSKWPMRIQSFLFYKHDPESYSPSSATTTENIEYAQPSPESVPTFFSADQISEFTHS